MRNVKFAAFLLGLALSALPVFAADAPRWMHALTGRTIPPQDDRTDAVLLYSETNVNVLSTDKIKTTVRQAYKILRPGGRDYGDMRVPFNSYQKITNLRGWCIPAQGKDYEVNKKAGAEVALTKIEGSELITDVRDMVLSIPAPDPGNIVGFEYEIEERPMLLQDVWAIQERIPVLESHYSLQLPAGWEYKPVWLNISEVKPIQSGANQWQWTVTDQKAIRPEEDMPPFSAVAAQLFLSFLAPGNEPANGATSWEQLGVWYRNLTAGRMDASPEVKQKVAELTASARTPFEKMQAIAQFIQRDIRYVAIELGIGGWQPHPASDVFTHRYGDCKDKATLMASMLREAGVESYYVVINDQRGAVRQDMPAHLGFNHVILAIKLPDGIANRSLAASIQHPKLGRLLFFDPTDQWTPIGEIGGNLQANYGLLVTPEGGELVELPQQPSTMNGIVRAAKLSLDANGTLKGDVEEMHRGDRAWSERWKQRTVTRSNDRIKTIETLLSDSVSNFRIMKADMVNFTVVDQPFGYRYTFETESYAKNTAGLLLVRPRVLGRMSSGILEMDKPRQFAIEFDAPVKDEDRFEIALPSGYEVDELPPPVDSDFSFASYHSRTEAKGNTIIYTRTFEIKELSVPVTKAEELKRFYRIIASDERNTAVLKKVQP